jgi:CheY-like chemotaxis protein
VILGKKGTNAPLTLYLVMTNMQTSQTVLVVEDEVFIRMSTVATLQDAGFAVLEAHDSADALRVLAGHEEVSLMVTDVRMPGEMDGLGLVARLQQERPVLRALVVSANSCAADAFRAGAAAFLPKPFLAHSIVRVVTELAKAA